MKLSLDKKRGFVQVKAARLRRVVKTHAVDVKGWDPSQDLEVSLQGEDVVREKRFGSLQAVFAKPGDLALELVRARGRRDAVAYSYLSGDPIGIMGYEAADEWFEGDLPIHLIEVRKPTNDVEADELLRDFVSAKYGLEEDILESRRVARMANPGASQAWQQEVPRNPAPFTVAEYRAESEEDARSAANFLRDAWSYSPLDDNGAPIEVTEKLSHLVALVRFGGSVWQMHIQPPWHASDYCCTPFDATALLRLARMQAKRRN